jgi:hypothetical protein
MEMVASGRCLCLVSAVGDIAVYVLLTAHLSEHSVRILHSILKANNVSASGWTRQSE